MPRNEKGSLTDIYIHWQHVKVSVGGTVKYKEIENRITLTYGCAFE